MVANLAIRKPRSPLAPIQCPAALKDDHGDHAIDCILLPLVALHKLLVQRVGGEKTASRALALAPTSSSPLRHPRTSAPYAPTTPDSPRATAWTPRHPPAALPRRPIMGPPSPETSAAAGSLPSLTARQPGSPPALGCSVPLDIPRRLRDAANDDGQSEDDVEGPGTTRAIEEDDDEWAGGSAAAGRDLDEPAREGIFVLSHE